jgi:hypothetical protein
VYGFNDRGQSILLHEGPIGGLADGDLPGVVELACVPEPRVTWRIGGAAASMPWDVPEVTLSLRRPEGDLLIPAVWRDAREGWSNGAMVRGADTPLSRIIAHWFNLPDLHGPILLAADSEGGDRQWSNRWQADAGGWRITLDVRPDHDEVWTDLHKSDVYVMTHVMELRRIDGATFTPSEAETLLTALHLGVSFALGRWTAPMLPVGEGVAGDRVGGLAGTALRRGTVDQPGLVARTTAHLPCRTNGSCHHSVR